MVDWAVIAAVSGTVLFSFLIVPEIIGRLGFDPRTLSVRALVWATFLAAVLLPAALSGFLFTASPLGGLVLGVFLAVAILYDYYRLNPERLPWARRRA